MSWLDLAIEEANKPIIVDVSELPMGVKTVEVIPLSANEFTALKADPQLRKITDQNDKNEYLGLRTVYEMLAKCDNTISWPKFRQLPINLLGDLATKVTDAIGSPDGGGELGKL
tara:strand:+ start:12430 stop:12771 length:342 start_codon:yes stop_codon:yes gene_type:complete